MKKQTIFFLLTLLITASCGKLPINSRLDGMWQLINIATDGNESTETKEERLYYAVQLELIGLQKEGDMKYLGRFTQTNDSLIVYDFRLHISGDNSTQASSGDLKEWGIEGTTERFGIEELTTDKMILRSHSSKLTFRKF